MLLPPGDPHPVGGNAAETAQGQIGRQEPRELTIHAKAADVFTAAKLPNSALANSILSDSAFAGIRAVMSQNSGLLELADKLRAVSESQMNILGKGLNEALRELRNAPAFDYTPLHVRTDVPPMRSRLEERIDELTDEVHELRAQLAQYRALDQEKEQEGRQRLVAAQHGIERLVDWAGLDGESLEQSAGDDPEDG